MSYTHGAVGVVMVVAAAGSTALQVTRPTAPEPPVVITELEWTRDGVLYSRRAARDVLANWSAAVLTEGFEEPLCRGGAVATYEKGRASKVWTLDAITGDAECEAGIPPGQDVYLVVVIEPFDRSPPYVKRTETFSIGESE